MTEQNNDAVTLSELDILFECPHCGKSLVIDQQAAGLMITCPDCQAHLQIPGISDSTSSSPASSALTPAGNVSPLSDHLEQIGNELGLIQASLDRLVSLLQDAGRLSSPRG